MNKRIKFTGGTKHKKKVKKAKKVGRGKTVRFGPEVKEGPTKGFIQPSRTRKKADIDSTIRKSKVKKSSLRASRIGTLHHVLARSELELSPKTSAMQDFTIELVKKNPDLDLQKINKENLRKMYNRWTQKRISGSPNSYRFADTVINSPNEFENLINKSKMKKLYNLLLESSKSK